MDPELPGSEKPGAIYDYIESKKDKKKIFETDLFTNRYINKADINEDEEYIDELDENMIYDNEFYQKYYNTLKLSLPANRELLKQHIYNYKKSPYIGSVLDVKAKDRDEFIVKLENGLEVIYDKNEIEKDKDRDIIQIMEFFKKAKNIMLWLGLRQNEDPKEIYIIDYEDLSNSSKFRDKIIKYKEQYGLTWYEFFLSAMGYNIFDLNEKDKEIVDKLYKPRILSIFTVRIPTADNQYNPYTHLLQFTPPSTGKTKFYTSLQGYLKIGYVSGMLSRARGVFNAETNTPGEIFYSNYIIIDEIDKVDPQEFIDFTKWANEGLDSGHWSIERGDTEKIKTLLRGRRLPRGFIFLGNVGNENEQVDEYTKMESIKKYNNARDAGKAILKEKSKSQKYINAIDALISRIGIVSVVTDRFNINRIKNDKLMNPIIMQEFVKVLQNEINKIALNYSKYIDAQKIKELGQFDDARLEENAKKIAAKIKALEIDVYAGEEAEELAVKIVKGEWKWP